MYTFSETPKQLSQELTFVWTNHKVASDTAHVRLRQCLIIASIVQGSYSYCYTVGMVTISIYSVYTEYGYK